MAIEIKRTPVLEGNAAQAFIKAISENKPQVSEETVRRALKEANKIMLAFKKKQKSK